MLPSQTQRVLMLLALVIGTPGWWWAASTLTPGDGLSGGVLSDGGLFWGLLVLAITALPALAAAGFVAAAGNPLSAVLCLALSGVIANHGNALVGVARRAADAGGVGASGLYTRLAVELGAGVLLLTVLLVALQAAAKFWSPWVPRRMRSRHLGGDVHLWASTGKSITAGLITTALGAVLTAVLVRSGDTQQVAGALMLGFAVAALVGHAAAPNHRPWATLASPAAVGLIGYGWATWRLSQSGRPDALLWALYTDALPGLALCLPMHYLTAGVAGSAIGVGIGQVLEKAKLGGG